MEAAAESIVLTQEEKEYWNGFCTDRLAMGCGKEMRKYVTKAGQTTQQVYYKPRVNVTDVRQRIVTHFNRTFEGYVRDGNPARNDGKIPRVWSITQNNSMQTFLQRVDPFQLINLPEEFIPPNVILLEHLEYRIERIDREGHGGGKREATIIQARIEDEEAFYQRFKTAHDSLKNPNFLANLTVKDITQPQLAGLVEGRGRWRLEPGENSTALTPHLRISSRYKALVEQIYERYGGYFGPVTELGDDEEFDTGYYIDVSRNLEDLIDDMLPFLVVFKPHANLVKDLEAIQPRLDKARNRRGDLAEILVAASGQYDLVDLLRNGFSYKMDELNEALLSP